MCAANRESWFRKVCLRETRKREVSEAGDTLIEILIALTIIGITAVSLLGAFSTAISASAVHRDEAQLDAVLKSFVEQTQQELGRQTSPVLFESNCKGLAPGFAYAGLSYTTATSPVYTANLTDIKYWSRTTSPPSWVSSCPDLTSGTQPAQQLLTATACRGSAKCLAGGADSQSISFVVADPAYSANPSPPSWCDPFTDTIAAGSTNNTFLVTTCNTNPTPSLSILTTTTPPPPSWVSLHDNGNGTGTLTFTPAPSVTSQTSYSFTLVATNVTNGTTNHVNVTFTVTVDVPVGFVSPSNGATVSESPSFSLPVSTSGTGPMILSESDNAPAGSTLFTDNADGTGMLTGTSVSAGTYQVTLKAAGPVGATSEVITLIVTPVTNPVAGIMFASITMSNAGHSSQTCTSQTISANIMCAASTLGNGGSFSAQVELVNSSGGVVPNSSGSPLTVTCTLLSGASAGTTVSQSVTPEQIGVGNTSTAPQTFTLANNGTGTWTGSMRCSVTISSTSYTITVAGSH